MPVRINTPEPRAHIHLPDIDALWGIQHTLTFLDYKFTKENDSAFMKSMYIYRTKVLKYYPIYRLLKKTADFSSAKSDC